MRVELKEGDRVILKDDHPYETWKANPCEGSEWFCEGIITDITSDYLHVRWDNGERAGYNLIGGGLELVGDMEVCV